MLCRDQESVGLAHRRHRIMTASPTKRRAIGVGGRPILHTSDILLQSPARGLLVSTQNPIVLGIGDSEEDHFNSSVGTRPCSLSSISSVEHQTKVPARQSSQKTPTKRKPTKWQKAAHGTQSLEYYNFHAANGRPSSESATSSAK